MKVRPFTGRSVVSHLSLGTWGLSGDGYGPVSDAVQDEVIQRARAYGITLFETADVYGRGAMEQRLGRLLGADAAVAFVTKIGTDLSGMPARKRFDAAYLREACARSSECLQRQDYCLLLAKVGDQRCVGGGCPGSDERDNSAAELWNSGSCER